MEKFSALAPIVQCLIVFGCGFASCASLIFILANYVLAPKIEEPQPIPTIDRETFLAHYNDRFVENETSIDNLKFDGKQLPMFDGPSLYSFVKYVYDRERERENMLVK